MIEIKFQKPSVKIKKDGERNYLFDPIRKTWLLLTDEEWVRQNFVHYLIAQLQYPVTLIALEKELELNGLRKRFDILVYDTTHKPWMLIECKASDIVLNDVVLEQILRYNMSIPVSFLVITNGHQTYGWERTESTLVPLQQLPLFAA